MWRFLITVVYAVEFYWDHNAIELVIHYERKFFQSKTNGPKVNVKDRMPTDI